MEEFLSVSECAESVHKDCGSIRRMLECGRLDGKIAGIALDIIPVLRTVYGDVLSEIVLYGSCARGEQTELSDIDIAVVLSEKPTREMTAKMAEAVSLKELECGKMLSVIDIDAGMLSKWKTVLPFYKNIRTEGIVLWKKSA